MITDKGTYDAIGLSEGGRARQVQYISAVHGLLQRRGLLIITSCNNTLNELVAAFTSTSCESAASSTAQDCESQPMRGVLPSSAVASEQSGACSVPRNGYDGAVHTSGHFSRHAEGGEGVHGLGGQKGEADAMSPTESARRWVYVDHVRTYKVYSFGGFQGSRVCTIAFKSE